VFLFADRDQRTGRFVKGRPSPNPAGRPKGIPTLATPKGTHLRDCILEAARRAGTDIDPRTDDGVTAYLHSLAATDKKAFTSLLGRVLPTLPVQVPLPVIEKPADLVAATSAVAKAVSEGELSTSDASAVSNVIANVGRMIELHELAARIERLEAQAEKGK
jgi:hypothetical protein